MISGSGRASGEGNGNPLRQRVDCPSQSRDMEKGVWQSIVHGAIKSQTGWSDFHFLSYTRLLHYK